MEKLCSAEINDVRKLIDLIANDYQLNELQYIPSVATSPFIFASQFINKPLTLANVEEGPFPPIYFVQWGFVEAENASVSVNFPNSGNVVQKVVDTVVEKLKDHRDGIFTATKLVELAVNHCNTHYTEYNEVDIIFLNIFHAELKRKQGYSGSCCMLLTSFSPYNSSNQQYLRNLLLPL